MKKFTPKLIRLSDEAVKMLPEALAEKLPAGHMAYAIKPEENGAVFISDAPNAIGHICTSVAADQVEFMPKITAKSARVNVDVCIEPQDENQLSNQVLTIAIPENLTDEELIAVIQAAGPNLSGYAATLAAENPDETGKSIPPHEALAKYLTEFGPGETVIKKPDLSITVEL